MLDKMKDRYFEKEQRKTRTRSIVLLSLILHLSIAIVYLSLPLNMLNENHEGPFPFDLFKEMHTLQERKNIPKPFMDEKHLDQNQELAEDAARKKIDAANNERDEVIELSKKILIHDVEVNKAPVHDFVPDLMTEAQLRDAEAANLSRLVSQTGPTDGKGILSDVVRVLGDGTGKDLGHSQEGEKDGHPKGSVPPGGGDPPGPNIIDLPNDRNGSQNVVFCLDVSASMQAAGLNKLELAIDSIKNSVRMLGTNDTFNIVTFSTVAKAMSKKMLPADGVNVKRALWHLDSFTPESIQDNLGTNILTALENALMLDSSVIVLVTDGLPTAIKEHNIETNTQKILDTVRAINRKSAKIYVVALEIDLQRSAGAALLVSLAQEHNGQVKVVSSEQLRKYRK